MTARDDIMRILAILALAAVSVCGQPPSPAAKKVELARKAIAVNPKSVQGYTDLALALARRARETSDTNFYTQAEEALSQALAIEPANFAALKVQVWLLLGRHEFAKALETAAILNKRAPDDVLVYGFLCDANVELGNYADAEKAAQWMLNLRPGNVPALTRTAYLRELFGDLDGAVEAMNMAYQGTSPTETEDRAWILTQVGHLRLMQGRAADAERVLQQALAMFPGYHYALGNLAAVRMVQERYGEAVTLLEQRYRSAPHAENLFALAEALHKAGREDEAQAAFHKFEKSSRAEMNNAENSNQELIAYYANYAARPEEALRIAKMELARRRDVHTLAAYAWALHAAGDDAEARRQMQRALKVGIQDPELLRQAAVIGPG
jgi:tetratricopeptide (TPR) repeat protein